MCVYYLPSMAEKRGTEAPPSMPPMQNREVIWGK